MRLIMLGTGPFAVPTLRALAVSEHDVVLVVAKRPRGKAPISPMQQAAEELQLKTELVESVNNRAAQETFAALAADLLVVCDFGEIIKPDILETTRLGGINLHGSLLPKYRGAAPVQWAILSGDTVTGNSVIQMTPGLDAGPCLSQQSTPIDPEETAEGLENRLAAMGAQLVCQVIDQLAAGSAQAVEQDRGLVSKAPRLKKEDGLVDWSGSAADIKNQVRGLQPWPRAYTFWHRPDGEPVRLNLDRVAVVEGSGPPGAVLRADERLVVATGEGALEICELQPAGKRRMQAAEFLRGNRLQAGQRLGPWD